MRAVWLTALLQPYKDCMFQLWIHAGQAPAVRRTAVAAGSLSCDQSPTWAIESMICDTDRIRSDPSGLDCSKQHGARHGARAAADNIRSPLQKLSSGRASPTSCISQCWGFMQFEAAQKVRYAERLAVQISPDAVAAFAVQSNADLAALVLCAGALCMTGCSVLLKLISKPLCSLKTGSPHCETSCLVCVQQAGPPSDPNRLAAGRKGCVAVRAEQKELKDQAKESANFVKAGDALRQQASAAGLGGPESLLLLIVALQALLSQALLPAHAALSASNCHAYLDGMRTLPAAQ